MKPPGLLPHAWLLTRVLRMFLRTLAQWRLFHVSVYGAEFIPKTGAGIIVSNHLSFADPVIAWAAVSRTMIAVAMKELWRTPLFLVMVLLGHIPIDRMSPRSAAKTLQRMMAVVDAGGLLLIYPEGKISPTGELLKFKRGALDIAWKSGAVIIPSGIAGSNQLWPLGSKRLDRSRHVVLCYGPAVHPRDYGTIESFHDAVRRGVLTQVARAESRLRAV